MAYTVSASERTTGSGNETETKALLYLMSFAPDCDEVDSFIVDFFNDVTGSNNQATKLWDVQSKKSKAGPKAIGSDLVTLYKNYLSTFSQSFSFRILFLGGVTSSVRKDETLDVFRFSDIKDSARTNVREGLMEACEAKSYIDDSQVDAGNLDGFLDEVLFVIAEESKSDYIKPLVQVSPALMPGDRQLDGIFNEIRDLQSAKKNRSVEGLTISLPHEAFSYCRHLKRSEIERFILSRIINGNPFKDPMPRSFNEIASSFEPEDDVVIVEDCKLNISKQMFDKNSAAAFWRLFEAISVPLLGDRNRTIEEIYTMINQDVIDGCRQLDVLATKYFIATVKDGLQ